MDPQLLKTLLDIQQTCSRTEEKVDNMSTQEGRIRSLEDSRSRQQGVIWVFGVLWMVALGWMTGIEGWVLQHFFDKK